LLRGSYEELVSVEFGFYRTLTEYDGLIEASVSAERDLCLAV